MRKKIVLITVCDRKKEEKPAIAGKLYKSSRIRHLYKKSRELGISLYGLSAKYSLVYLDEVLAKETRKQIETTAEDKGIFDSLNKKSAFYLEDGKYSKREGVWNEISERSGTA